MVPETLTVYDVCGCEAVPSLFQQLLDATVKTAPGLLAIHPRSQGVYR